MIGAIRSEFRKLLSVRSTYVITAIAFGLLIFVSLYVVGYKNNDIAHLQSLYLADSLVRTSTLLSIFAAIISLLLFAHEYRYNTIMYTLTYQKSRSKILSSKIIVVAVFTFLYSMIGIGLALGSLVLGLHLAGGVLPNQNFDLLSYAAKTLIFIEGYALGALLIIALIRNQIAAIVVLLIEPGTIESLLGLLLKHNAVYLPFTALSQVINSVAAITTAEHGQIPSSGFLSPTKGALVFAAYLVAGWAIAWILFLKRDAN